MKNNCVKSFISSRSENGKAFKIPLNKNGKKLKKKKQQQQKMKKIPVFKSLFNIF
jgi:hypothetical protein